MNASGAERLRRSLNLRGLLVRLFKDKWKLLLAFVLVAGAATMTAALVAPEFVAEAKLYVKFGREYTYRAQAGDAELVAESFDRGQVIKSEIEILQAQDLADSVIARLGARRLYPELFDSHAGIGDEMRRRLDAWLTQLGVARYLPRSPPASQGLPEETARLLFLRSLEAHGGAESNIVTVTFAHRDGRMAAETLAALIEAYMEKRRPLFAELRAPTLEPEVAASRRRVDDIEARLAAFRLANGIVSFDAQRQLLLEQQGALERDLQAAQNDLASAERRVARLGDVVAATPSVAVLYTDSQNSDALVEADSEVARQARELGALLERVPETAPEVKAQLRNLARAEQSLAEMRRALSTVRSGPNPAHEALAAQLVNAEADHDAAAARTTTIAGQLARTAARLQALDAHERGLGALVRDRDIATAAYRMLTEKLQEARVFDEAALGEAANVRVMQAPRVPVEPQSVRPLILLLGLFAALCVTLAVAFVSDLMRHGFMTPEQLERALGLPVLATVPLRRDRAPLAGGGWVGSDTRLQWV